MENTETLIDENGFEINVTYEQTKDECNEEGHGYHCTESAGIYLLYCEIIIAGIGINLTPMLNQKQTDAIINRLTL